MQKTKQLSLAEKIVQGKYAPVISEQSASSKKQKQPNRQLNGPVMASPKQAPAGTQLRQQTNKSKQNKATAEMTNVQSSTNGMPRQAASKKNTMQKPHESDLFVDRNHENEANKTTEEVIQAQNFVDDDGHAKGLSDNLNGFDLSANMGVPDDNNANYVDDISPRFLKDSGKGPAKEDDAESISLTQYYLKGSVQERKTATLEQEEFNKTLNRMEQEDVPAQVIDEYKKSEILRKSMAVVKKHAAKMEAIRSSPERYDRVKGKINSHNPYAANLSSFTGSKRVGLTSGYENQNNIEHMLAKSRAPVDHPIAEGRPARGTSPQKGAGANPDQTEDWYKPELGNIPYAPLTKKNREKIEKRDAEIADKEKELDDIMQSIKERKEERAEKEAVFKAQDKALKKKRKAAKAGKRQPGGEYVEGDGDQAPSPIQMDEPLDEEGLRKKDNVLDALQHIKTADFTELKAMRNPTASVKQILVFTGELLLGRPCDVRKSLQELMSKPRTFIELSLGLEERLDAQQLKILQEIRKAQVDVDVVKKSSNAAYGLALWLTALVDFSHHSGLIQKAKFVPTSKKREEARKGWQYTTNTEQLNDDLLMRMPKWARGSKNEDDPREQMRRLRQSDAFDDGAGDMGGDRFEQQVIQPKELDAETQQLVDNYKEALIQITKANCTEMKSLNNPTKEVLQVIVAFADYYGGSGHEFKMAKNKMFEIVSKRWGETPTKCSEEQLNTLRVFKLTKISPESVRAKASAAAGLVKVLHAQLELQERFLSVPDDSVRAGLPDVEGVSMNLDGARKRANEGLFATVQGDMTHKTQGDDLYYAKTSAGKKQKHKRKRSAGYQAPTSVSNKRAGLSEQVVDREEKAPLDDSQEEMDIYGNPKHRFYNEELEVKTKAIQDQFANLYSQLEEQRHGIDRDAFYEAIDELNYGGITKFEVSPTRRLVKHHTHTVEQKEKFRNEHQAPTQKGNQYSVYSKSYIVEPADGKGLNYKLIDKKPLKFYDQVLSQDVIKKKVYKDKEFAQEQSVMQNAGKNPNVSSVSRRIRMSEVPLSYQETIGKRGIGVLVDECRAQIDEQNKMRSMSPYRGENDPDLSANGGYASVSARNLEVPNGQRHGQGTQQFLQVPGGQNAAADNGLMAHLNKNREETRATNEQQLKRGSGKKAATAKTGTRKTRV